MFIFNKSKTYPNMKTTTSSCLSKMHQNKHVGIVSIYNPSKFLAKAHSNDADLSSINIFSKKVHRSDNSFLPFEIKSRKVNWKDVDLFPIEIASNKILRKDVDFSLIERTSNKVHRNSIDFLPIEITSKNTSKQRGNSVDHLFLVYDSNIDIKLTSIWRFVSVGIGIP